MNDQEFVNRLSQLLQQIKQELSYYEDYVSSGLEDLVYKLGAMLSGTDMDGKKLVAGEIRKWIMEEHSHVNIFLNSFLLDISHEEQDLLSCYKCIKQSQKFSVHTKYYLYYQLKAIQFCFAELDSESSITAKWKLFQQICDEFRKKTTVSLVPIPKKDRNEELVVIITESLLNYNHAPSKIALDMCVSVVRDWKKSVLLINTAEVVSIIGEIKFYRGKSGQYDVRYVGKDAIMWGGVKIPFFQCEQNMPNMESLDMLLLQIRQLRPMYVLNLGGSSMFANLVNEIIPVLTISLTSGLEPTQTRFQILRKMTEKDRKLLKEVSVVEDHVIEVTLSYKLDSPSSALTKEELEIPEGKFILAVVGNRLNEEVSQEFLEMLDRLCEAGEEYFIVFVGKFLSYEERIKRYPHIRSMLCGYQNDLPAFLQLCDLFVNPIRQGGGTSGAWAVAEKVPVVTTAYGDIASAVGEEFWVKDYEEMLTEIQHYFEDREYYTRKSQLAEKVGKELTTDQPSYITMFQEYEKRLQELAEGDTYDTIF